MASLSFKRRQQLKSDPTKLQEAQLSEEQWRTWLQEEVGMATDRDEKTTVVPIFEAAVTSFPSIEIWLLYCRFILDDVHTYLEVRREAPEYAEDPVLEFPDGVMAVYRRAVELHGFHFVKGSEIWGLFMEFLTFAEMPVTARRAAFIEQLRIPHRALSDTFSAYSRFEFSACNNVAAEYEAHMAEGNALYQATLALTTDFEQYETAVANSSGDDDRTTAAAAYIEHVKQLVAADQLPPAAIPAIYERAVTEWVPPAASLWASYLQWIKPSSGLPWSDGMARVADRALVACPTGADVFRHWIRVAVATNVSSGRVYQQWTRFLTQCTTIDAFHAVSLEGVWALERCGLGTQSLLETAMESRAQKFPDAVPASFALDEWCLHWIARGKADAGKEAVLAAVIEFVTARCTAAATWARVLRSLTALPSGLVTDIPDLASTESTRALFHAVLGKLVDDPTPVLEVMLAWEYAHGTMPDVETVAAQLDYYRAYYAQYYQYAAETAATAAAPEPDDVVMADSAAPAPAPRREKRKGGDSTAADRGAKKAKPTMTDEAKIEKLNRTILVKHVAPEQEGGIRRVLAPFGTIRDVRFLPRKASANEDEEDDGTTLAFVQFTTTDAVLAAFKNRKDLTFATGAPVRFEMAAGSTFDPLAVLREEKAADIERIAQEKERKHAAYSRADQSGTTVFVANVHKRVDADTLRAVFARDGRNVTDVRLMVTKHGESKGYGYIEFATRDEALAAVAALDGHVLPEDAPNGRAISVAMSDPSKRKNAGKVVEPAARPPAAVPMDVVSADGDSKVPTPRGARSATPEPSSARDGTPRLETPQVDDDDDVAMAEATERTEDRAASATPAPDDRPTAVAGTRVRDLDPRVLFVSNVAFATKEPALRAKFAPFGDITEFRALKTPQGKPRGIVFVTFADADAAQAAITALHGTTLDGRTLSVQVASPTRAAGAAGAKQQERLQTDQRALNDQYRERALRQVQADAAKRAAAPVDREARRVARKAFVRNVPAGTTEEGVRAWLTPELVAGLTHVSVADEATGGKMHVILSFADEAMAAAAVLLLNRKKVEGGVELIAEHKRLSAAPIRGANAVAPAAPMLAPTALRRGAHGKQRIKVTAAPKPSSDAMVVEESGAVEKGAAMAASAPAAPKSNDFFRTLFTTSKK
ncbi:RNA-binding protein 4F [Allomyces javanicus]|nr:RNA-binding protein 4F [Allomyces javanicus]